MVVIYNRFFQFVSRLFYIERGFSQMNLQQSDVRNRLTVQTVSHLLMISVNGPPIENWSPRKYVISWLKSVRQTNWARQNSLKSAVQANFLLAYKNVVENVTDLVSQSHCLCQISVIFQFCIRALPCRLLSVIADNIDALFNSECKWSLIVVTMIIAGLL